MREFGGEISVGLSLPAEFRRRDFILAIQNDVGLRVQGQIHRLRRGAQRDGYFHETILVRHTDIVT